MTSTSSLIFMMRAAGDPELRVYGIFGYPLKHTVSPAIHNRAFDVYGLKAIYFAFERKADRFRRLMRARKALLLDGFNVTVPYKEQVIPYLDRLSPEARAIGAVNTVQRVGTRWVGHNTDAHGFLKGLKQANFRVKSKTAVILGAGGAARAVAYALAKTGARRIIIANRRPGRAIRLVRRFGSLFPRVEWAAAAFNAGELKRILQAADLVVNATKAGLGPSDPAPVPRNAFPQKKLFVYDLIYKPRKTKFLAFAERLGHPIRNGETMLLHQGAKAFEIWTGKKAPLRDMKKVLRDALVS